jgi:hypothetical protein
MITSFPTRTLSVLASLSLVSLACADPVASWNPGDGKAGGNKVIVPDTVASVSIEGPPEADLTLETTSDAPDGAGALVFGGAQTQPMRNMAGTSFTLGSGTTITVDFQPAAGATEDMTIFASPGIELRYLAADQKLAFIVYYDTEAEKSNYAQVVVEAKPGEWNQAKLSVTDTELVGEVNGLATRKQLLNAVRKVPSTIMIGLKSTARPFKGKIGKITISQD